jgi:hypothetical protein
VKIIPPAFFPNMPAEVREIWLDSIAVGYGWPFESIEDSTRDTRWYDVLLGYSLKAWHSVTWEFRELDFASEILSPGSRLSIASLKQEQQGLSTIFANVAGTKERFRACADFIRANGRIPGPLVIRYGPHGIDIIDGNHRIAALFDVGIPAGCLVPAWVAFPPKE